jgi:ligand-binding sensor domain-containing protein/signal transduction histidine kinase
MLVMPCAVFPQSKSLQFKRLTTDDGLSRSWVRAIAQDSRGFIWVGTDNGLNRYDGYTFKVYKSDIRDSLSLADNRISSLLVDSYSRLWIGTETGCSLYDSKRDNFRTYVGADSHSFPGRKLVNFAGAVNCLFEDRGGKFWIGTTQGFCLFDPEEESLVRYSTNGSTEGGMLNPDVRDIAEDREGYLWLATPHGLHRFDPVAQRFTTYLHDEKDPKSLAGNEVSSLAIDANDYLWIGTHSGLSCMKLGALSGFEFVNYSHDPGDMTTLSHNYVMDILASRNGGLWIGTENGGLNFFDDQTGSFTQFKSAANNISGLNNDSIYALLEDRTGDLWVGTFAGGLNITKKNSDAILHYASIPDEPFSLSYNSVRCFAEDSFGEIWVGTDGGGLNRFDRKSGRFHRYTSENSGLPKNAVFALREDPMGNIWVGTWAGGLSRFDRQSGEFTVYTGENSNLPDNRVLGIEFDNQGRLWAGTCTGGLVLQKRSGDFEIFRMDNSAVANDFIRTIIRGANGKLLIPTLGGFSILDPAARSFETFESDAQDTLTLSSNEVISILAENDSIVWAGTVDGLNRVNIKNRRVQRFYEVDGLPGRIITGIAFDGSKHLWLSTRHNGICRLDPQTGEVRVFSRSDGIQRSEFNNASYFTARDGSIFFGGNNGFNLIRPDLIKRNSIPPPVLLTDFEIFNKPVAITGQGILREDISETKSVTVSYEESVLSFRFAALDFTAPDKNTYAYKLEGFDKDWNHVGRRRTASYTNLDPGDYIFRVKGTNNDGVWSEKDAVLELTITPPFWRTIWFRFGAAAVVVVLVVSVYRLRVRSIKEQNHRLESEVAARTSELNNKNSLLETQKYELETALAELKSTRKQLIDKAHKAGMADVAAGVLHNIGNTFTSIATTVELTKERIRHSKIANLKRANQLLRDNLDHLSDFLTNDTKGAKLIQYYFKTEELLDDELAQLDGYIKRLNQCISSGNEILRAQQKYAGAEFLTEVYKIAELVDEAFALVSEDFRQGQVQLTKDIDPEARIEVQKTKVIQIILHLYNNALEAMHNLEPRMRELRIEVEHKTDVTFLKMADNGVGIERKNLEKIFNHGFSTKPSSRGFGLHDCANYMAEMGGRMWAESAGPGKGATFVLQFGRLQRQPFGSAA